MLHNILKSSTLLGDEYKRQETTQINVQILKTCSISDRTHDKFNKITVPVLVWFVFTNDQMKRV